MSAINIYCLHLVTFMQLLDDTNLISDEIIKLHNEGLGTYVDKAKMESDGILHVRKCFSAFVKNDVNKCQSRYIQVCM